MTEKVRPSWTEAASVGGGSPRADDDRRHAAENRSVEMLAKLKPFLGPVVVTLVVMVLVNRVPFLRGLVYGATA